MLIIYEGAIKREVLADATYGGDDNGEKERLDQWLNVSGMVRVSHECAGAAAMPPFSFVWYLIG